MYTYEDLLPDVQRKSPRKLANNTWIRLENDAIVVKYHNSDIVTLQPDKVALNSCGWMTSTTKARLNWFIPQPYRVSQINKVWYVWDYRTRKNASLFYDGMGFSYNMTKEMWVIDSPVDSTDPDRLARQASRYVAAFANAFVRGRINNPDGGDCWYCYLQSEGVTLGDKINNDHILAHVKENYFVPSLLYRAIVDSPNHLCALSRSSLSQVWNEWRKVPTLNVWEREILERDIRTCLKRYVYQRLGLAF